MKQRVANPCFRCVDRTLGCHSACENYKAWREKNEKEKEMERVAKEKENALRSVIIAKYKK